MTMTTESEKVLCISFSHDLNDMQRLSLTPTRWLIICTTFGVRLYDLSHGDAPRPHASITKHGAVLLAEMFLDSKAIAMVTASKPKCLIRQDLSDGDGRVEEVGSYRADILAVKLSHTRIVVLFKDTIRVYDVSNEKEYFDLKAKINPQYRACALTFQTAPRVSTLLAYPSRTSKGEVCIYDIEDFRELPAIPAHHSEIVALSFNGRRTRLATASERGTVIRVFEVRTGKMLHELQRGLMTSATIQSLAFKDDSNMLACSSDKETVHIFRLDDYAPNDHEHGMVDHITWGLFHSLLPPHMSRVLDRDRAYAKVTLPEPGENTIAAWSIHYRSLLVATKDGVLRIYDANSERSGIWPVRAEIMLLKDAGDRAPGPGKSE